MYCTLEQARAAGADGTDAEVLAAILDARRLVDRYTGDVFEPTPLTVVGTPSPDGTVLLPFRVRSVSSVTPVGRTTPLSPGAYTVMSSEHRGGVDAVILGGGPAYNVLVVGAEPWNGGYARQLGGLTRVEVAGVFGHDEPPVEVRDATASLAAARTLGDTTAPVVPGAVDVDDEGNAVSITVDATPRRAPTTGSGVVDALLSGHVRDLVRIA